MTPKENRYGLGMFNRQTNQVACNSKAQLDQPSDTRREPGCPGQR